MISRQVLTLLAIGADLSETDHHGTVTDSRLDLLGDPLDAVVVNVHGVDQVKASLRGQRQSPGAVPW
jgi:hypothetical protein